MSLSKTMSVKQTINTQHTN